jgi:hypothetical protein
MAYLFSTFTKFFAMERMLSSHRVTGLNEKIRIEVLDNPGPGGACHTYRVSVDEETCVYSQVLEFQNGPIQEVGVNGISVEALLAIVEDRLIGFQSGQFSCRENAVALTKVQEALMWLGKRTRDRLARGVEGTMEK